jgi:hypothetical protein
MKIHLRDHELDTPKANPQVMKFGSIVNTIKLLSVGVRPAKHESKQSYAHQSTKIHQHRIQQQDQPCNWSSNSEPNNTVRIGSNLPFLSGTLFEFTNSTNVNPNNHNGSKGRARINSRKLPAKHSHCKPPKNQPHGQPRHKINYPWQTRSQTLTSYMPLHHQQQQ